MLIKHSAWLCLEFDKQYESHYKPDNSSFERAGVFKCLGTTLIPNFIEEEINSRLKSGNACYHSVQNVLFFSLLSINIS
jgi:hypothetical protein